MKNKIPDRGTKLTILGYARKQDLTPLLDEIQPEGSHVSIGIDHPVIWQEDEPYEHLTPVFILSDATNVNWHEHHQEQYHCNITEETKGSELYKIAENIVKNITKEEYDALRMYFSR